MFLFASRVFRCAGAEVLQAAFREVEEVSEAGADWVDGRWFVTLIKAPLLQWTVFFLLVVAFS